MGAGFPWVTAYPPLSLLLTAPSVELRDDAIWLVG